MRFYQSLECDNEHGVKKFVQDRDVFSVAEYQFEPGEYIYTLRTPEAHSLLLTDVLEKVKKRILLFSPFIRLGKLKDVFSAEELEKLKRRSVDIKIVTLPNPCNLPAEQSGVFSYLNKLNASYSNFTYDVYHNFHAKTLIADNDFMCEGSFNWLSAVTQIDHDANNFEVSVAIRGKIAGSHVHAFENTMIGKHILSKSYGKQGYCIRFNDGDYVRDDEDNIAYFPSPAAAKQAAYTMFTL